ncbi:hypothetical protein Agub_g14289, partial [Astrephomene gubernaculifera]
MILHIQVHSAFTCPIETVYPYGRLAENHWLHSAPSRSIGMDLYDELELIGKGTYGKVFKVRNKSDGQVYVIKKVQFDGAAQSEAEAALREGQVLSLLRHPHVVPYKEFFKHTDGDVCLVMALCEGGDLLRYIRELRKHGKTVPEPQVWQWLVQLLLSLSYVHSKRILHRDVKTQNIFLSEGKVLLGDFGLAKQLQRTFEMARTPIGTPYYMAPEIYEEQPYSFKSDVWALGCVVYEMMTGKAAFAADNLSRVVLRVIRGQYDPLPESYSSALRAVVTSMLCKEVRARPDANTLLTVPAVVPHVQSYLESLTTEGPGGWATWRMKLPLAAIMQMSQALEAAGVPLPSSAPPPPSDADPANPRASYDGFSAATATATAVTATTGTPAAATADLPSQKPEGGVAAGPAAVGGATGGNTRAGKLPPLPGGGAAGGRLPPIRTPYGLASPFMVGGLYAPDKYAELQVLAQQMIAIRSSQTGEGSAPQSANTTPTHANRRHNNNGNAFAAATATCAEGNAVANGGGSSSVGGSSYTSYGISVHEEEEAAVAAAADVRQGGAVAEAVAMSYDGCTESAEVRALDRTLLHTLEVARKAAADSPTAAASEGGSAAAAIDEAWLAAGLPQGGFGFGAAPAAAAAAGGAAGASHHHHHHHHHHHKHAAPDQEHEEEDDYEDDTFEEDDGEDDDGFASLSQVTLHTQSLSQRRANLERRLEERLGEPLMRQVMQVVASARQAISAAGGFGAGASAATEVALAAAEVQLRRQLDSLLPPAEGGGGG